MSIPSTVICDMQSMASIRQNRLEHLRNEVERAKSIYENAIKESDLAEAELRLVCAFLQEHNSGALDPGETWLEEFFLSQVPSPEVAELLRVLEKDCV